MLMKGTEQVVECYVPPSAFVSSCARLHERRDMTGVGVATWDWVKKDLEQTTYKQPCNPALTTLTKY